jgi:HEAT repeat protein
MTRAHRLRHGTAADRIAALQEIAACPPVTPEELTLMVEDLGAQPKALQRRAAEAVAQCARIDARVVPRILALLDQAPWRQRWGAVFALSLLAALPPSALPTLLEAVDSDDGDVRWAAADLLKQLAQREATIVVPALMDAARHGGANQRKMSLYILRDLRLQDGIGVALDALDAPEIEVRLAALAAFVALAADRARAARRVVALVDDRDARMRRAAAAALGQLAVATDAVWDVLNRAAATDDPGLRRAADRALLRIRRAIS